MDVSVVTTLYRSAPYLDEFCGRITAAVSELTSSFEIVLVNDGSPDDSLARALALQERNSHVRVIDLSRNFGHHKAMFTGLALSRGRLVFQMDCDLEEDPESFATYYRTLQETMADVVYGVVRQRHGSPFHVLSGKLFYSLFNLLSSAPLTPGLTNTRLMTRAYVDALVAHRDQALFMAGLWAVTGFSQVPITVEKRRKGSSTYTLSRKIALFVTSITSFSIKPLAFIFILGVAISALAAVGVVALVIRALLFGGLLVGWASVIVSIWFMGGLTILSIGVLGIYLATIFVETKPRPYTIVRQEYEAAVALAEPDAAEPDAAEPNGAGPAAPAMGALAREGGR